MSKAVKGKVSKEILQTNTKVQSSSKYRSNSKETGQTNNEKMDKQEVAFWRSSKSSN